MRLAPLYDIASTLPYHPTQKLELAMMVGGEYRLGFVGARHWERLGEDVGLTADETIERVRAVADRVGERVGTVAARCRTGGLEVEELSRLVEARALGCSRMLSE